MSDANIRKGDTIHVVFGGLFGGMIASGADLGRSPLPTETPAVLMAEPV